jgi:hypothetical protein
LKKYLKLHLVSNTNLTSINDSKTNTPRIIPFESVKPYVNAIPLFDYKIAATNFTDPQFYDEFSWVELPMQVSPREGYFIAQVIGESMNKEIPNGSFCLFEEYKNIAGSRDGEIVLVQCTNIQDGNYGSGFTIKKYSSVKVVSEESYRHKSITLKPFSYDDSFKDIELLEDDLVDFKVIGIYKKTLNW